MSKSHLTTHCVNCNVDFQVWTPCSAGYCCSSTACVVVCLDKQSAQPDETGHRGDQHCVHCRMGILFFDCCRLCYPEPDHHRKKVYVVLKDTIDNWVPIAAYSTEAKAGAAAKKLSTCDTMYVVGQLPFDEEEVPYHAD